MVQKLKLNPNRCYLLGLYECGSKDLINLKTSDDELAEKFIKLLTSEFEIKPGKLHIEKKENLNVITLYNSKLKKLFDRSLERKSFIFKYLNEYSSAYFAAIFDYNGGRTSNGRIYINRLDAGDSLLLEKLNIHSNGKSKSFMLNPNLFIALIKGYSLKVARVIH
ncbi:homing endonuclease [Candidatus Mancarchaeum acidiphilum]|uniref:Homing endonuclease n=1 Tax=Candidatus Mancarchaeum acidiphilum TaxID=1920749 RepID=A0A218NNN3_9ARCH|nr:homing endonuclease [Candidatus Mancarchaeum acidiphilum]